jgi:hypothetical protein
MSVPFAYTAAQSYQIGSPDRPFARRACFHSSVHPRVSSCETRGYDFPRRSSVRTRTLVMLSLCSTLLVGVVAHGQQATTVKAKIPFAFSVAGNILPAGQYDFRASPASNVVAVEATGKPAVLQGVVTRLAGAMHTTPKDAHIVFDKVGSNYTLSELWAPGNDGFLLSTTKAAHEHAVVDVPITK